MKLDMFQEEFLPIMMIKICNKKKAKKVKKAKK